MANKIPAEYTVEGNRIIINPDSNLEKGKQYRIVVSTLLKDMFNSALTVEDRRVFSTEVSPFFDILVAHEQGISIIASEDGSGSNFNADDTDLSSNHIYSVLEINDTDAWIGTVGGVEAFGPS